MAVYDPIPHLLIRATLRNKAPRESSIGSAPVAPVTATSAALLGEDLHGLFKGEDGAEHRLQISRRLRDRGVR